MSFSLGCSVVSAGALLVRLVRSSSFSWNGALVVLVEVLPGPACVASAVLLAAVFSLMVCVLWSWGLCILVKVLPRIALCRFWWRFSPKLLRVISVVAALSLCRDELSLLPVGLFALQSAWALPVKASCAWPCIWLLRWPACLVVRFQVFSAVLADFVCPRGSGGLLCSCTRRALADGGLVSVVVLGWLCFVWKCQSHVVVLPLACAEHCFRFVPDSVGFCGSRVCATTLVGGRGVVLFSSAA
ncbi:hypothetical protein Taro_017503 [Colocasia esculenta]|uniref:Uncharacterized protein n=1 Tax=Colocasia esculenta TaxID=4460 RepID=A0A843URA4_COLES|nr:hypothetical protein [Colocasia esculenta]